MGMRSIRECSMHERPSRWKRVAGAMDAPEGFVRARQLELVRSRGYAHGPMRKDDTLFETRTSFVPLVHLHYAYCCMCLHVCIRTCNTHRTSAGFVILKACASRLGAMRVRTSTISHAHSVYVFVHMPSARSMGQV